MKIRNTILILSAITSFNSFANDVNAIPNEPKGAFGINFGDSIKNLNVKTIGELTSGEKLYEVEPPSPLNSKLEIYYVRVTPKTNRIFEIWGDKNFDRANRDKCNNEKEDILSILENKYGKSESIGMFNVDNDRILQVGNVAISATCRNLGQNMSIRYYNKLLQKDYETEKKQIVIEKTDSSML